MLSGSIDHACLPEPYRTRVMVWRDTKRRCDAMPKLSHDDGTRKSRYSSSLHATHYSKHPTRTHVVDMDTLDAAKALLASGSQRVAVLNLADPGFPGGNVQTGSGAQEESLFRRTTLCMHLPMIHTLYPLEEDACLISRRVVVFRDTEERGYCLLDRSTFEVDVLSCAGVRHPTLTTEGRMNDEDLQMLLEKVRLIYTSAMECGVDGLVLGALGCGAFRCPPDDVASVFRQVNLEFDGAFEVVVFAILTPKGDSALGSLEAFRRRLQPGPDVRTRRDE